MPLKRHHSPASVLVTVKRSIRMADDLAAQVKGLSLYSRNSYRGYGVVFWTQANDNRWYFLVQLSYSATMHDYKLDPLRGQSNPGETPYQTARRKMYEESHYSLLLPEQLPEEVVQKAQLNGKQLFHFRVRAAEANPHVWGDLQNLNRDNRATLNQDELNTLALVWANAHQPPPVRFATQLGEITAVTPQQIRNFPLLQLDAKVAAPEVAQATAPEVAQFEGWVELPYFPCRWMSAVQDQEEVPLQSLTETDRYRPIELPDLWVLRRRQLIQYPQDMPHMKSKLFEFVDDPEYSALFGE